MGWNDGLPAKQAPYKSRNAFNFVSFTIGAEAGDVINVAVACKTPKQGAIAERVAFTCYLSDNADGSTLTATVPTSNLAVGTNGVILGTLTTNKAVQLLTNAAGLVDLNITQTAAKTYYLVVVMPDGSLSISGAITFA